MSRSLVYPRNKELKKLLRLIDSEPGWDWVWTKSHHIKITREGEFVAHCGGTPSCSHAIPNLQASLRRAGLSIPRK